MACKGIVHKHNSIWLILQKTTTATTMATTTITMTRMTKLPGWYYRPPRRGRRPRRVGRSLCPPSSPPWRSWSRWCCCSGRSWWWWWWWCLIGFSKFLFSAETCRGRWPRSPWPRTRWSTRRCAWSLQQSCVDIICESLPCQSEAWSVCNLVRFKTITLIYTRIRIYLLKKKPRRKLLTKFIAE